MKKILIIGYGSIGKKKHTKYVLELGLQPIVLTKYPETRKGVQFIQNIKEASNINYAIIATPTAQHLSDIEKIVKHTTCKNILLEKPVESNIDKAKKILKIAKKYNLIIKVAYCLRFLNVFKQINKIIYNEKDIIRLVNVIAGQYLPEWRPDTDYKKRYSSDKKKGGGVHLDLSHELDYIFWLFGYPNKIISKTKDKISTLEINSIDYYHILMHYTSFIVSIQLDYFRKGRRTIEFIGENKEIMYVDFMKKKLYYQNSEVKYKNLFNIPENYKLELQAFISGENNSTLTSLQEGVEILKYL